MLARHTKIVATLGPGGEALIRAGRAHRMVGVGGEARSVTGFRPAGR